MNLWFPTSNMINVSSKILNNLKFNVPTLTIENVPKFGLLVSSKLIFNKLPKICGRQLKLLKCALDEK